MKKLLLHTCCAPCLTSVHEQLHDDYDITSFWFNPNIEPLDEHALRLSTLKEYCSQKKLPLINFGLEYELQNQEFEKICKGVELAPEGGERCARCIEVRLKETAEYATRHNFALFGTTLSVSPHKDSEMINKIGKAVAAEYGLEFLEADFKKNNGYRRSVEICKELDLYRQNYCGCRFSMR